MIRGLVLLFVYIHTKYIAQIAAVLLYWTNCQKGRKLVLVVSIQPNARVAIMFDVCTHFTLARFWLRRVLTVDDGVLPWETASHEKQPAVSV